MMVPKDVSQDTDKLYFRHKLQLGRAQTLQTSLLIFTGLTIYQYPNLFNSEDPLRTADAKRNAVTEYLKVHELFHLNIFNLKNTQRKSKYRRKVIFFL